MAKIPKGVSDCEVQNKDYEQILIVSHCFICSLHAQTHSEGLCQQSQMQWLASSGVPEPQIILKTFTNMGAAGGL